MKTLKDFFENCTEPELFKKVWEQGKVNWSDFKRNPNDYYAANTGSVHGLIYYSDTVKFAKKNHLAILQMLDDFESECGKLSGKPSPLEEEQQYFNWLTWFAWESMAGELINYLEN